MMMTDIKPAEHRFEKAGLGRAPFKFVTLISFPPPSLAGQNPTAYNNALREIYYAKRLLQIEYFGLCEYCGMALMNNYIIRDVDNVVYVVGSNCVAYTGDAGVIRQVEKAEKTRQKKAKQAKARSQKEAKAKAAKQTRKEKRREFFLANEGILRLAYANRHKSKFVGTLVRNFLSWGALSDRQIEAIEPSIKRAEEFAAARAAEQARITKACHVGTVGERIEIELTLVNWISSRSAWSPWRIAVFRDRDGNTIKTFGNVPDVSSMENGNFRRVRCTVKEHSEYRDEKQTMITRLKLV